MKRIEDFNVEKIELNKIQGGNSRLAAHSDQNTITVGGNKGNSDDGDDSDWD